MALLKPSLRDVLQDRFGNTRAVSVTLYESDGSALLGTLYDYDGVVVTSPISDSDGVLQLRSNYGEREVLILAAGASVPVRTRFQGDPNARPLIATDFAGSNPIDTGVYTAYDGIMRAVDVAESTGRPLFVPPGTYLLPNTVVLPDNVHFYGAYRATILKHADNSANPVMQVSTAEGCLVENFRIDGNRTGNRDASNGFNSCEMFCAGEANTYRNLYVYDFNCHGFEVSGTDCYYENIRALGPDVAVADYAALAGGSRDIGSLYGMFTSGASTGNTWVGLRAERTRSAGIYVGGIECVGLGLYAKNCHRKDFPDGVGGGQIAVATPTGGTLRLSLTGVRVGAAGAGTPYTSGLEIGGGSFITVNDYHITGQTNAGIAVTSATTVKLGRGSVGACTTYGLAVTNALFFSATDIHLQSNTVAGIILAGTTDYARITNPSFLANGTPMSDTSSGTNNRVYGNANGAVPASVHPVPLAAAASADRTLTGSALDVTGCSLSLTPGRWQVQATVKFNEAEGGGTDLNTTMIALLVTSGGTATVSNSTAAIQWTPQAANESTTISRTWDVTVTATTTVKLQGLKSGGTGTGSTAIKQTHTTLEAFPAAEA